MRRVRQHYLVLDIETVPDLTRWQRPEPQPQPEAPPRDNFPPLWAHEIIAIGALELDADYRPGRFEVIERGSEASLLASLSTWINGARPTLVTYNGRAFDLPVIALRSLCHALPMAWYYRERDTRARYSDQGHLDLCDWLADHGAIRAGKLDAIARLIGLPGKNGIDGSQVEGLYRAGELAAIERYCLHDVAQTAQLLLRFRMLQGQLAPERYRACADELTARVDAALS